MVGYDHAGPDATLPDRLAAAQASRAGHRRRRSAGSRPTCTASGRGAAGLAGRAAVVRARAPPSERVLRAREPEARARSRGGPDRALRRAARRAGPGLRLAAGGARPRLDAAAVERSPRLRLRLLARPGGPRRRRAVRGGAHDRRGHRGRALTSLGSRVRDGGLLRFNPSPFEREGVPGYGWPWSRRATTRVTVPVEIEVLPDGAGVSAEGTALRFFDEADVGDLYNFCYAREDQIPKGPHRVEVRGHEVEVTWEGCRALMRIVRRVGERFLRIEGVIHNERPDHRVRIHVGLRCRRGRLVRRRAVRAGRAAPRGRGELDRGGIRHVARTRGRDGGCHRRAARRGLRVRDRRRTRRSP